MPKIAFEAIPPLSGEQLVMQVAQTKARGLPLVRWEPAHGRRLAIVGGGPSIRDKLDEIREFTDVWAINGACRYLRGHGIASTLMSLDPAAVLAEQVFGATRAILATRCHAQVFEALKDAEITVFDVVNDGEDGVWASCASVTGTFQLGAMLGYRKFSYFGCEGSFPEQTHAYMNEAVSHDLRFVVECGGKFYLTTPDLYMVTQRMVPFFRKSINGAFTERSGGLLRALIENDEHDIVQVTPKLMESLVFKPKELT